LVEVLAAIFILIVGLLGISATTVGIIQGNADSKNMTTAITLAQDQIESLRNKHYTDGDLSSGDHSDAENPIDSIFMRTWTVTDNATAADTKNLTVTITWDWRGVRRSVVQDTIIAK